MDINPEALKESGLIKAAARYNEAVMAVQEAYTFRHDLDLRDWQRYMESCNADRIMAHDSLVISYRVYNRLCHELIEGALVDDRYAIADVAEELLKWITKEENAYV